MPSMDIVARLKLNGDQFSKEMNAKLGGIAGQITSLSRAAGAGIAAIVGSHAAAELGRLADAAKKVDSTLKLATAGFGSFSQAQRDAERIALTTRNGLEETATLYGNFIRASKEMGGTQEQAARATETFSKALKIGGADASAAASATLQFGQALASGVLRGDEFNSVMEASPRIARLLADSLGIPIGQLRQMAADGKLTSDVLYKALTDRKFTASLDEEFRQLPKTFDEAMGVINNSAIVTFGAFDRGGGFSTAIANFVTDGAGGFADLSKSAEDFGITVRSTIDGLVGAFDPLVQAGLDVFRQWTGASSDWKIASMDDVRQVLSLVDEVTGIASRYGLYGLMGGKATTFAHDFSVGQQASQQRLIDQQNLRDIAGRGTSFDSMGLSIDGLTPAASRRPPASNDNKSKGGRKAAKAGPTMAEMIEKSISNVTLEDLDRTQQAFNDAAKRIYQSLKIEPDQVLGDLLYGPDSLQAKREAAMKAEQQLGEQRRERAERDYTDLARFWSDAMRGGSDGFFRAFKRQGESVVAGMAADLTMQLIAAVEKASPEMAAGLRGAYNGFQTGGPIGAILGGIDSAIGKKLPAAVGKAVGGALQGAQTGTVVAGLGKSLGLKMSTTGAQIGGAIGSFGGPIGQIAGSVIGGVVGGLFKKSPRGYATIGATDDGTLGIVGTGGNKGSAIKAGVSAAGDVTSSLAKIVEALGGAYDPSKGSVSIGQSGDSWHVDTTGKGRLKKSQGGNDFDQDYEAAVRFAVADLIKDGVVTGISDAASRILKSGQDLDAAIEKAITIESIPKLLRARLDPLGAAIDDLNTKWAKNIAILKEGGATAAQMAEAQQLYNLELADVKANTKSASETLKDFVKSMKIGSDSPLSLRDQEASALAELQPYLNKINAGETIDQDAYRVAAESYLDIERQLYGSTQSFFDKFDMIMAANTKAIDKIDNAVPIRTASDPFAEKTAQATQASANILEQLSTQQQQALDLSIQGNVLLKGLLDALKANGGRLYTGLKAA